MALTETLEHGLIIASGFVSTIMAGTGAYYAGRKNRREESAENRSDVNQLIAIKDEMIDALKEDRDSLKVQLAESLGRERDLAKKVDELERRLRENERENRQAINRILEAMASSERCVNAAACANHRPVATKRSKVGGTD